MKRLKKVAVIIVLAAAFIMMSMPVSAEHFWNYDIRFYAAYGTPEIDGTVSDCWDAAPVIEIRLNDCPMYERGFVRYQNQWDGPRNDDDFLGRYRIMWDDNYIYFLEERTDDVVNLSGTAEQPWYTDGILAFTQVDSPDGSLNPDGISVHIFWIVGNGSDEIGGQVMARIANMADNSRETIEIPGARVASSLVAGGYVVEVAIPWAFYRQFTPGFTPEAGTIMGLSFVVHDSDADFPSHEKQILFPFDEDLVDEIPGGYDFGGWGTLEFLAAPAVEAPDEIYEYEAEAEAETPEPIGETAAPQTGDPVIIGVIAAVVLIGILVAIMKRRKA